MGPTITDALARYGYLAIFLLVAAESIGVPLPGETGLITGAVFAAAGRLSIIGVIASAAGGGIVGGTGGYWLGRSGGVALIERYGRLIRITPARMQRVRAAFARRGDVAVFIGRFVAILRAVVFILAGAGMMPFATFTLYNVLGAFAWAITFGVAGYAFGDSLPAMEHHVKLVALVAAALVAVGGVVYYERHRNTRSHDDIMTP